MPVVPRRLLPCVAHVYFQTEETKSIPESIATTNTVKPIVCLCRGIAGKIYHCFRKTKQHEHSNGTRHQLGQYAYAIRGKGKVRQLQEKRPTQRAQLRRWPRIHTYWTKEVPHRTVSAHLSETGLQLVCPFPSTLYLSCCGPKFEAIVIDHCTAIIQLELKFFYFCRRCVHRRYRLIYHWYPFFHLFSRCVNDSRRGHSPYTSYTQYYCRFECIWVCLAFNGYKQASLGVLRECFATVLIQLRFDLLYVLNQHEQRPHVPS